MSSNNLNDNISDVENIKDANNNKNNKRIVIIAISILVSIIIIGIVVYVIIKFTVLDKKKEGYKESMKDNNTVEVNGHYIDCTPEIEYMNEFIKTSKGLS